MCIKSELERNETLLTVPPYDVKQMYIYKSGVELDSLYDRLRNKYFYC